MTSAEEVRTFKDLMRYVRGADTATKIRAAILLAALAACMAVLAGTIGAAILVLS